MSRVHTLTQNYHACSMFEPLHRRLSAGRLVLRRVIAVMVYVALHVPLLWPYSGPSNKLHGPHCIVMKKAYEQVLPYRCIVFNIQYLKTSCFQCLSGRTVRCHNPKRSRTAVQNPTSGAYPIPA